MPCASGRCWPTTNLGRKERGKSVSIPGRTRVRLAKLLQASFPYKGTLALTWKPEKLYPATGAYRTNQMLDCWRWEGFGVHVRPDGSEQVVMEVGSYDTMTELVKAERLKIDSTGEVSAG